MAFRHRMAALTATRCLELFVVANVAFLGFDILIAHAANRFADPAEWAPVAFSAIAPPLLVPGIVRPGRVTRTIDVAVAIGCIALGVVGMVFHLTSGFFAERTLHALVYSAPFVAPLSYIGVGLLLLLVRLEPPGGHFGEWVLLLAIGGFVGNFVLSLLDHAQNAFFSAAEWIPVAAAAYGVAFFVVALASPSRAFIRVSFAICGMEAMVGMAGFVMHVAADAGRPAAARLDRFLYGAPVFAPLLFTNLALLAAIGLWQMRPGGSITAPSVPQPGPGGASREPAAPAR